MLMRSNMQPFGCLSRGKFIFLFCLTARTYCSIFVPRSLRGRDPAKQALGRGDPRGVSEFRKTIHSEADTTSGIRRGRGAPKGNRNAWKTGRYSKEVLDK